MQRREFLKAAGAGVAASAVAAPAVAQSPAITFLVAHGAWSAGWAWRKMHPLMRSAGHELVTPTYTGLGEREHLANPAIDLEVHIRDMLGVIKCEQLRNFILVGHSYGGMVATGVADRVPELIRKVVYLDAFVPTDGQALVDLLPLGGGRAHASRRESERWLARSLEPNSSRYGCGRRAMDSVAADAATHQDVRDAAADT